MAKPVEVGGFDFRFECVSGCTECCTKSGYVYVTANDIETASKYLNISKLEFNQSYCERVDGELRLSKPADHDCHFLDGDGCAIHAAKPLQCRTFPYWPELVDRKRNWKRTAQYCPGIGQGSIVPIDEIRAAAQSCRDEFPE